ncbi:MAG: FAD-binding protein, partial [Anaerolineales bacterium]|nr:FAD-binding protein [Anaerolineales bacterium]
MQPATISTLRELFSDRLHENASLAGYTSARIGGPADALIFVRSADELANAAGRLWEMELPFIILGGGSNLLVADSGFDGLVLKTDLLDELHLEGDCLVAGAGVP